MVITNVVTKQESLANAKVHCNSACVKAPSEETYGKSTQGTYCWKYIHSMDYNTAVANNTGLSSLAVFASQAKSREILRKFER